MSIQFEFDFEQNTYPQLGELNSGECFRRKGAENDYIFIVASPVRALHNSHLISDVVNRGDVFVVALKTGALTVFPSTFSVERVNLKAMVTTKDDWKAPAKAPVKAPAKKAPIRAAKRI